MEDSTTYQYIIEQGAIREARNVLLRLGASRFGTPVEEVKVTIQEMEDLPRLHRMEMRLLSATSWNEVLETP